jgi:hypothetical protein
MKTFKYELHSLVVLAIVVAAINCYEQGSLSGIFVNHTIFGGIVAGWAWCLHFHR